MRLAVPAFASIVGSVVSSVLSAIAHAIGSGITALATWTIGGLAHAAVATTAVNFDTWFQGPWRAMLSVAGLAALPLLIAGVLESLAHGEGPGGIARVLGRLGLAAVGSVLALALVQLLLSLVDVSCVAVERGSGISISAALARLGTALGVTAAVGGGAAAAIGALLLALLAALCALVLWLELEMRTVLILVTTAFLPLGLSGLLWPKTASWLRRLGEVLTAIAISKLVIVVVLVLGAAALTNSPVSLTAPGSDLDAMVNGVAFLGLATFGLPIALRVVPFAAEAALSPGRGGVLVRSGYAVSRVAAGANSTSALVHHLRGTGSAGSGGEASPPTPPGGRPPGSGPSGPGPNGSGPAGPNPNGPNPNGHGPSGGGGASGTSSAGRSSTVPGLGARPASPSSAAAPRRPAAPTSPGSSAAPTTPARPGPSSPPRSRS